MSRKRGPLFVLARRLGLPLVVGSVLTGAFATEPPAQVAVSPSRFEIPIGPNPTTESLTLFNYGERAVEIRTSVASWDLDEDNSVRLLDPTEESLDQWLVLNPLEFSIPAKASQTVRFSVRPRLRPRPGEHRAMIYFDQALEQGPTAAMQVRFRLGVAVYAQVGEIHRVGRLNSVKVIEGTNPVTARLDISSEGSSHVRMDGHYTIWPADRYPGAEKTASFETGPGTVLPEGALAMGRLPGKPVLPGTRRGLPLSTAAILPPGTYVLDLDGRLSGKTIDQGIRFTIPYPAQVSGPVPD